MRPFIPRRSLSSAPYPPPRRSALRMSRLAQSVSSPDGHGLPAFGEDLGPGVTHLFRAVSVRVPPR
jgi:hypothetical protein